MRAVWWKELRELGIVALLVAGAGVWAASETAGGRDQSDDMFVFAVIGGLALGVLHGALDRRRRHDHFLMHRPLAAEKLQLARSLAGLSACTFVVVTFLVALLLFTIRYATQHEQYASIGRFVPEAYYYGAVTQITGASIACAAWAVTRFAVGTGRGFVIIVLALMVPAAWGLVSRAERQEAAALYAGSFLLLFGALHLLQRARTRYRLRALLALLVMAMVWFEASLWLRSGLAKAQNDRYPFFGMSSSGELRFWIWADEGEVELDEQRNPIKTWSPNDPNKPSAAVVLRGRVSLDRRSAVWELIDRVPGGRRPWPWKNWGQQLADALTREEASRRELRRKPGLRLQWEFHLGRFLCRRAGHTEVLAGFGPAGYTLGPAGADGARFGKLGRIWTTSSHTDKGHTYMDEARQAIVVVRWQREDRGSVSKNSDEPVRVEIETNPIGAGKEAAGRLAFYGSDRAVMLVSEGGAVVARFELEDNEVPVRVWRVSALGPLFTSVFGRGGGMNDGTAGMRTLLAPAHPTRSRTRFRYFSPGAAMVTRDATFEPTSFGEHAVAAALGALVMLRPLPLNLASSLASPPATPRELNTWWWRDPLLAGGSDLFWLLVSIAAAICCAWWARRSARLRCATRREQHFWIGVVLALGPLGLIWMRVVVGRALALEVGTSDRAVNLEATPDNDAPWPEPQPTGTEVFG